MKRIFGVVFVVVIALLLAACGSDGKEPSILGNPDPNFALPKADICGVWYGSPENGGREITLNPDGTCVIDGQTYYWAVDFETETELQLHYGDGSYMSVLNLAQGMSQLCSSEYGVLIRTPLLWEFRGIWETDAGRQAYLDEYDLQFIDGGHTNLQVRQEGDALVFTALAMDGTERTVRMHIVDGYPVAELTDGSGNVTTYYRPENRPPVNEAELLYQEAIQKLNTAVSGGYIHYDDSNKVTHGCSAYAHIYQLFEQLGDYKDAKQYLANFKVIKDVYVDVKAPGETFNTGLLYLYGEHDSQGRRLTGRVLDAAELGIDIAGTFYKLTYGEDGRVSQILTYTDYTGDDPVPYTVGIPAYDEKGNMIRVDVTWTPDAEQTFTYTSTFTYDENGRLLTIAVPTPLQKATYCYRYYYDAEGKLLQRTQDYVRDGNDKPSSRQIEEYIYDGNGYLVEKRTHRNAPGDGVYVWRCTRDVYVNDADGKRVSFSRSFGDVLSFRDERGNMGSFSELNSDTYTDAGQRFADRVEAVFGMRSAVAHNWLVNTAGMELHLGNVITGEPVKAPMERQCLYTDVYIYCPEN